MKTFLILILGLMSTSILAQPAPRMFESDVYDFDARQNIFNAEDTKTRLGKKSVNFEAEADVFNCSRVLKQKIRTKVLKCTEDQLFLSMDYTVRARFLGDPQEGYWTSPFCLNPSENKERRQFKVKTPKNCEFSISNGGEIVINTYSEEIAEKYGQIQAEHKVCEENLVTDLPSYYFNECDQERKDAFKAIAEERERMLD